MDSKAMHEIEQKIADQLQKGKQPTIDSLGGFASIFSARHSLSNSRWSPELLHLLCREVDSSWPQDWQHLVLKIMQDACHGPTIHHCITILDGQDGVTADFADKLFGIYAQRSVDHSVDGLVRTAFLDGCLRLTIGYLKNRFRLIDVLTRFDSSDLGPLNRRFVKIVGVCNCHWPCNELHQILLDHLTNENCIEQSNFELGMHHFGRLLDANSLQNSIEEVRQELTQAEQYFKIACCYSSVQAEATLYRLACRMLRDFYDGELSNSATLIAVEIDESLTALHAYFRTADDPSWLGSRTTELVLWRELWRRLRAVDIQIERDGWYEPQTVIETAIFPIFNASRCLLKRNEVGGIEMLLQPRLVGTIASTPSHLDNLREWLRINIGSSIAGEVSNLIARVEGELQNSGAATAVLSRAQRDKIFEVLDNVSPSSDTENVVRRVVQNAMSLNLRNLNSVQQGVLIRCVEAVANHPDYQSADIQTVFDTTLLWLVRFIDSRLNVTKGDVPEVTYLFRPRDDKRALEGALQNDFMTLFRPFAVGSQIEVKNVGGGRADVFLKLNAEQLVVEVKREHHDCSFDSLASKYSGQTFQYQNTCARLGFMLVLDQTDRGGRALHISDAIRPMKFILKGEAEPRHVIVCLVSGDRLTPSELSKLPKRKQS